MDATLVVMAAGIGSRFKGGIKQLTKVNDKGETIMELNIKNAEQAGFNKVVFIIREELKELFDKDIIPKINIKYDYAYQSIDEKRSKPWGTGHAILSLKGVVKENFCVVNADDYYTLDSFKKIYDFFTSNDKDSVMVGYKLKNTVFVPTGVNRGICHINDGKLVNIEETYDIKKIDGEFISDKKLDEDSIVSMNIWGFRPNMLDYLENDFKLFLDNIKDYEKEEYLIGDVIQKMIDEGILNMYVLVTDTKCIGITYSEDIKLFDEIIKG